ncbi:MAG TPA: transglutaminase family protein [Anaeromyxobacteraceae bacterium]|nr:transglutaminase family protein [Anaeromyxobacteraceae bacterium]
MRRWRAGRAGPTSCTAVHTTTPIGGPLRLLIQHRSSYRYPRPASLGPHRIRLRPANHARARIESYSLKTPAEGALRWQQDPYGNHVAHLSFRKGTTLPALELTVELAVDIRPVNPFDFFLDDRCEEAPFAYPEEVRLDVAPFLDRGDAALRGGPLFEALDRELPRGGPTVPFVVGLNEAVNRRVRYVIREEAGIWTPEETLEQGRGSCRDQAVLLIALLRARGLAARFASGYLVQLTDEGMIPDEPKGVGRDVVDLHAWVEVYLPGGGWIGLDPTSGLLTGEGHIPLACVARPALAAPLEGTADLAAEEVRFDTAVGRLGHEVRPTAPFTDEAWEALLAGGDAADLALSRAGLELTTGGEPTFNARDGADAPEWNGEALGPSKWPLAVRLADAVRARMAPGAAVLRRPGKWYPGESLPRWALELVARADGAPAWRDRKLPPALPAAAERVARALARRLGVRVEPMPAYEDPWRLIQDEAELPEWIDPLHAGVADPEERRRLARILGGGPDRAVAWVLPLAREGGAWRSDTWRFRRGHLFLTPGDSPAGLRLPLTSLGGPALASAVPEPDLPVPDPRRKEELEARQARLTRAAAPPFPASVRTALCVEHREGALHVFLPPFATAEDFLALVAELDALRDELGVDLQLEGYPPPSSPAVKRFSIAPDPGVLEVNIPPAASAREHAGTLERAHEAALAAGLQAEKYLLDGRLAGSGGGHHVTLGGPTPLRSPLVRRPDLLASLITFVQHHPSLSYLFTGLFVGPTSQAPRLDEARHDALYEMEIALAEAVRAKDGPPWLGDALFRHLLVDVSGNTHRAEISIDKLYDWRTPHGRQGVVELRAFEMPPHPRLAAAQAVLVRALLAAFADRPYRHPLVRWGMQLHDRFLLPTWLWRDFEEVLAALAERGVPLPAEPYRAFLELRCPVVGRLETTAGTVEVRNALEPWNVLGEEPAGGGTSRYVDSSVERIEIRAEGIVPERHRVSVNGLVVPVRATGVGAEVVGGVRFRAWAPEHALHPHLGIHHPLRIELVDGWTERSLGACAYHVWHPEGRAFLSPPLTRFEAAARRAQRFTTESGTPWPVRPARLEPHPDLPFTLDLRRLRVDRPMPEPEPEEDEG